MIQSDGTNEELTPGEVGGGSYAARRAHPEAVILIADILRWVIPKIGRLPRNVRYGLGARMEGALTDVLEELVAAQYARGTAREQALTAANRRLQVARHLWRLAGELGVISQREVLYLAKDMVSLGKQVGAWQRSSGRGSSSASST